MGKMEEKGRLVALFKQKNYLDIIDIFNNKFDLNHSDYEVIFYYAHSLLNTNQTSLAKESFQAIIERFPEKYQGYEGLYLVAEKENQLGIAESILYELLLKFPHTVGLHIKYALFCVKTKGFAESKEIFEELLDKLNRNETLLACYATQAELAKKWQLVHSLLNELIQKSPSNQSYKYKYGKNINRLYDNRAMVNYFESEVKLDLNSFMLNKGYLESLLSSKQWLEAIEVAESVYKFGTTAQRAEIMYLTRIAYVETKRADELEKLLSDLLELEGDSYYLAWKAYALIPFLTYNGNIDSVELSYTRWKEITRKFPNSIESAIILGTRCLELNKLAEAEAIFSKLIANHPQNHIVHSKWCLVPFYGENYVEFLNRSAIFKSKFPRNISILSYYIYVALIYQNKKQEFFNTYLYQVSRTFSSVFLNNKNWINFERNKIKQLFNKQPALDLDYVKNLILSKIEYLPRPSLDIISSHIVHSENNEVLVICFSSMDGKRTAQHYNDSKLDKLDDIVNFDKAGFDYQGFARNKKEYNFLLLRDLYNCWYQIHTKEFIRVIEDTIFQGKYKKVVCLGTSAGGFAALMFGQLLKCHLVFAYGPQALAWTNYSTLFNKACEVALAPDNPHLFDIGQLQYDNGGFIPKTHISLCDNNAADKFSLVGIDTQDTNLDIDIYPGDKHAMYQVIGKRKMFEDICNTIDAYTPSFEAVTGHRI